VTTLEERYRRVLGFLPKGYRAERGEEMLTALLDGAGDGQKRPTLREVWALATLSVRLHFGARGASPTGVLTGQVARRVVLVWFTFQAALGAAALVSAEQVNVRLHRGLFGPGLRDLHIFPDAWTVILLAIALLLGLRRTSRILCVGSLLIEADNLWLQPRAWDLSWSIGASTYSSAALDVLILLAVFPAFHRGAPRPTGRRWWFAALIVGVVVPLLDSLSFLTTAGLAVAVAAGVGVWKARVSPEWPIALTVSSLSPLLLGLRLAASGDNWLVPELFLLVSVLATAVLAVASLASVIVRRRLSAA
jgi:hypothetical protein